jgi:hypothetical protein
MVKALMYLHRAFLFQQLIFAMLPFGGIFYLEADVFGSTWRK